jgi:hypothetical protein
MRTEWLTLPLNPWTPPCKRVSLGELGAAVRNRAEELPAIRQLGPAFANLQDHVLSRPMWPSAARISIFRLGRKAQEASSSLRFLLQDRLDLGNSKG